MQTLHGKTVLITGATSGIGRVTALELAKMGATVVIGARNMDKGLKVVNELIKESKNDRISVLELDLEKLESVRKFAAQFLNLGHPLHILINNAGLWPEEKRTTVDGFELTMAANHFGHFLLTNLLLDKLKESAPSRVVNVSSVMYKMAPRLNLDNINYEKGEWSSKNAYAQSKLCNILFTNELAKLLQGTGVGCFSLHPGVISTGFQQNYRGIYKILKLFSPFLKTPEQGARCSIYAATSTELVGHSGAYLAGCRIEALGGSQARKEELAKQLWDLSAKLVHLNNEKF